VVQAGALVEAGAPVLRRGGGDARVGTAIAGVELVAVVDDEQPRYRQLVAPEDAWPADRSMLRWP
jgi:hypothetical protein